MTKNIAWICNNPEYVLPYQVEIDFNLKASHQHYKYASEALEGLKKKKVDLVILDP